MRLQRLCDHLSVLSPCDASESDCMWLLPELNVLMCRAVLCRCAVPWCVGCCEQPDADLQGPGHCQCAIPAKGEGHLGRAGGGGARATGCGFQHMQSSVSAVAAVSVPYLLRVTDTGRLTVVCVVNVAVMHAAAIK